MSLVYLSRTILKNKLKELLHSPSKLIVAIVVIVVVGMSLATVSGAQYAPSRPVGELYAMILALYAVVFLVVLSSGFGTGASFYSMADVHFLFPAPISPRVVLFYGLARQMGASMLVGLFLLFQYGWLNMTYGVSLGWLLAILLGYACCMFCAQLTAMAVYSFTSANEKAQSRLKAAVIAACVLCSLWIVMPLLSRPSDPLAAMVARVNSGPVSLFPVAGWLGSAVSGLLRGEPLLPVLFLALTAVYAAALILSILRARTDFYEDVLLATEVSHSAITAKKEGSMMETARHVKLGKTGIGRGWGANAFYYKHLLENRRSRILCLDKMSWIMAAFTWIYAWMLRDTGVVAVLAFSVYLQIFTMATGRWARELLLPYIYLLPEPPFVRLLHLCREGMLRNVVESLLLFIPVAVMYGLTPVEGTAFVILRITFGLVFIAGNVLISRILGSSPGKGIGMVLYMLLVVGVSIPGVVLAMLAGIFLASIAAAFGAMSVWNMLCGMLILFFCRDMLDCSELNNR